MNKGARSGWRRSAAAVELNMTLNGIQMVGGFLSSSGQVVFTWDDNGSFYFIKKNNNDAGVPNKDQDVIYADFFSLIPAAGVNVLATDNNLIAYSHFLPLGSDIPANIQPTLAIQAAAGTGATANLQAGFYSGDASGIIHIHSGSAATAAGTVVVMTFASAYTTNAPVVLLQQYTSNALGVYCSGTFTTGINVAVTNAMATGTDYYFFYQCLGL